MDETGEGFRLIYEGHVKGKGLVKTMRKNFVRMLALLALLCVLPVMSLADQFAVVKGGRLNLRAYPSAQSTSLGKYASGTWVIVTGDAGNGWYSVRMLGSKSGYMSGSYLNFGVNSTSATVKYANGGYVNLRSGPSTDYPVTMRVTTGTQVTVVNDSGEWDYIAVNSNGTTVYGYMYETYINRGQATTAVVSTRNGGRVNVRSGPSSSYSSIGSLASGTRMTILLKGNGWYMISANGITGFMSTGYISGSGSTVGSNTGSSSSGTVTSTTAWVNNPKSTQVLNLRETPSQSAHSIGQYRNGTQVKVISYGSTWCEVYVGTRHGYMMTRYLSFNGSYTPPSYNYPVYPQNTPGYVYPVYPTVTPTPTPLVQYITPKPQIQETGPKAGTRGTLAVGAGSGSTMINVYNESSLTSLKATYPAGQSITILQYGASSCMILIGGEVGYVSTWNVNY